MHIFSNVAFTFVLSAGERYKISGNVLWKCFSLHFCGPVDFSVNKENHHLQLFVDLGQYDSCLDCRAV